jgi:hypothetical protein
MREVINAIYFVLRGGCRTRNSSDASDQPVPRRQGRRSPSRRHAQPGQHIGDMAFGHVVVDAQPRGDLCIALPAGHQARDLPLAPGWIGQGSDRGIVRERRDPECRPGAPAEGRSPPSARHSALT